MENHLLISIHQHWLMKPEARLLNLGTFRDIILKPRSLFSGENAALLVYSYGFSLNRHVLGRELNIKFHSSLKVNFTPHNAPSSNRPRQQYRQNWSVYRLITNYHPAITNRSRHMFVIFLPSNCRHLILRTIRGIRLTPFTAITVIFSAIFVLPYHFFFF